MALVLLDQPQPVTQVPTVQVAALDRLHQPHHLAHPQPQPVVLVAVQHLLVLAEPVAQVQAVQRAAVPAVVHLLLAETTDRHIIL